MQRDAEARVAQAQSGQTTQPMAPLSPPAPAVPPPPAAVPPSPQTPPADMQTAEHAIQQEREMQERSIEEAKERLAQIEERTK